MTAKEKNLVISVYTHTVKTNSRSRKSCWGLSLGYTIPPFEGKPCSRHDMKQGRQQHSYCERVYLHLRKLSRSFFNQRERESEVERVFQREFMHSRLLTKTGRGFMTQQRQSQRKKAGTSK